MMKKAFESGLAQGHSGVLGDQFPATPWSVLLESGEGKVANDAWERLARAYWQPLYAFLRRRGSDHHSAADDIQGFFAHLLKKDFLRRVGRGDGLFRSFLLKSLQNWRTDQHRAAIAQKRGSGDEPLSLNELEAASIMPIAETDTPEEAFDRSWARIVYQNALTSLKDRLEVRGRGPHFAKLCGVLTGEPTEKYERIAEDLDMSVGAVKQTASSIRREFGMVLREEIRRTVVSDEQVDDEIRYLLSLSQKS